MKRHQAFQHAFATAFPGWKILGLEGSDEDATSPRRGWYQHGPPGLAGFDRCLKEELRPPKKMRSFIEKQERLNKRPSPKIWLDAAEGLQELREEGPESLKRPFIHALLRAVAGR